MMIESLFKPLRIGKGLLSLLAMFVMLLAPQGAWAEDDYGLTVAGVAVTSANANAITGQNITGNVSYTKKTSTTPATLTLEGATIIGNVVSTVDEDLIVSFVGSNTITVSSDSPYAFVGTASSSLTFLASGGFQLVVNSIDDESNIAYGWKSSPDIAHSESSLYAYEKDWYADCTSFYVKLYQNKKYDVWYNDTQFCDLNLQPETGVTFVPGSSKVKLSSFSNSSATIKSSLSALTVSVSGENSLSSIRYEGTASPAGTLTITKDEQSSANLNKLTLSNNTGAIYGFSEVSISTPMMLKTPVSEPESWNAEKDVVISDEPIDYNVSVAGTHVTSANYLNVLGDAGTPSVSFTPAEGETPATLTLEGATIGTSDVVKAIESSLSNLTINLKGNNTLYGSINYTGASNDVSITFTGTGSLVINNNETNGYINRYTPEFENNLALKMAEGSWTITPLVGPTITSTTSNDGLLCSLSTDFSDAQITYSLTYESEDLASKNKTNAEYTEAFLLEGPATVTGKVTYGEKYATTTGKYFGFEDNEISGVMGTLVDLPAIIPTIDGTDGVTVNYGSNVSNNKIDLTSANVGKTTVTASLTSDNQTPYALLNSSFSLKVNILPTAPTISLEAGTYNESQTVTITSSYVTNHPENASIKYYYGTDNTVTHQTYSEPLIISESKTLNAWVSAVVDGVTYNSDPVQVQYVIRQDAGLEYIANNEHAEYADYTIGGSDNAELPTLQNPNELTISYSSSNTNVANVDATTGAVSIVGMGETTITATSEQTDLLLAGNASYVLTVYKDLSHSSIQVSTDNSAAYTGLPITPTLTITDGEYELIKDEDYMINEYKQGDNSLDELVNTGTYTIFIVGGEESGYVGNITATFTITQKAITADMVTLGSDPITYDGSAKTPTVAVADGQTPLTLNTDYSISYQKVDGETTENVESAIEAGTYNVVVTAKENGNYSGTATKSFTIAPASIAGYTASIAGATYTGEELVPTTVTLTPNEGDPIALTVGTDCTLSYKKGETNVNSPADAGTYTVTIKGVGNYTGTTTASYTIEKIDIPNGKYTAPTAKSGLTYTGGDQTLVTEGSVDASIEDATVQYYSIYSTEQISLELYDLSDLPSLEWKSALPQGKEIGNYAVLYRIAGAKNYKDKYLAVEDAFQMSIGLADISKSTIAEIENKTFTGAAITPTLTVTLGDYSLIANTDYTVAYTNNVYVGQATATITGKGNFTGSKSANFNIVNKTLAVTENDFHNHWMTYYSDNGDVDIPASSNIGAFVATGVANNSVTVTQISNIPEGVAVLLNNETTTTTEKVFNNDQDKNLLEHATSKKVVNSTEGDFYGLYNGVFIRVTDEFPAGKNYLLIPKAVNVNTGAPQLNIVFENETNMTGIDDVRSKKAEVGGDLYDLQGRKVQKPSKKGLYISNGHKVVVNK